MSDRGISDRFAAYRQITGLPVDAPWLRDPVSASEVEFVEAALGNDLPSEIVELLRIHNGGRLLDTEQWVPALKTRDGGLLAFKQSLGEAVDELAAAGLMEHHALSSEALWVSVASQVGIVYDLEGRPGCLLYLDVTSDPPIAPLARDLATLLDAYVALAEAGFVVVEEGFGPVVKGPPDEVRDVFVSHKVADVASSGLSSWLAAPEAATFSID